jgi:hypothetical protein
MRIPEETLASIQRHFHDVIRERAERLLAKHPTPLPDLFSMDSEAGEKAWFRVPGMYGGFSYWFEGEGEQTKLITESWCRVVGGSGQRHEITATGSQLTEKGFV